mmetsp:Transcript_18870/g.60249  ORF Transcript_18870/g.60249 Transcript_18870/m.60249 type:complete len:109 (+) Transcript_18870:985-1311(+)
MRASMRQGPRQASPFRSAELSSDDATFWPVIAVTSAATSLEGWPRLAQARSDSDGLCRLLQLHVINIRRSPLDWRNEAHRSVRRRITRFWMRPCCTQGRILPHKMAVA